MTKNWAPFLVQKRPGSIRSIESLEGRGDRLRAVAFAELQAREAFLWAAETFTDASDELRTAWKDLAQEEDKHLGWLLDRMKELGISTHSRAVSDYLWRSFIRCKTAQEFAKYMSSAEDRGRIAGEKFEVSLKETDPKTAKIFGKIAEEEKEHVLLAKRFFPETLN